MEREASIMTTAALDTVKVDGLEIGYRELGEGPPVLLVHGWPTSSHLWRNVMPPMAGGNRVIAVDLPGFGASDKPVDATYDFAFFERAVEGLLEALGVDEVGIAGHDLGGPVAVHWAIRNPDRVTGLALLNTLLFPPFAPEVLEFVTGLMTPGRREELTSRDGLGELMHLAFADASSVSDDLLDAITAPFPDDASRLALARAGVGLDLDGLAEIDRRFSELRMPLRVIYGEQDGVLPDVADTMARVKREHPDTEVTALPDCGHFLQEEAPERVGELLAEFFAGR
jgi:pimeloyl-ACP methyl ester carboxylesterase